MPDIYQVDAFTDTPFRGNPAAVCLLEEERTPEWMQAVAAEMNLSETAFVRVLEEGFDLRWFTPTTEVNLCGHATLATAHVLWEAGWLAPGSDALFQSRSGPLKARRTGDGIELDFPADPTTPLDGDGDLKAVLDRHVVGAHRGREDWLVELESERAVKECRPDLARLAALPIRCLIVTARGDESFDFVSRVFAPAAGIDEDPVTGSAHCTLANYWTERLGKREMLAWQASPRGGQVKVRLEDDRVFLAGQAVTVLGGKLRA